MRARTWVAALWLPVLAGAVVGLAGWFVGVVPPDAVLIGVLVAVVLAVPRWAGVPETYGWPDPPERTTAGGWHEVRRIATVIRRPDDRRNVFVTRVAPQLRALAEARLDRLGVAWDDPAAARMLGPDIHALLDDPTAPGPGRERPPIELAERVLGRLDEIPDEPHRQPQHR